jgi:hypothetical protein
MLKANTASMMENPGEWPATLTDPTVLPRLRQRGKFLGIRTHAVRDFSEVILFE